jgi:hypothetical protein
LLPDAILRDSRSCRPHSRAVQGLRHMDYWVRFICPLQPVVAATDLRTRLGWRREPPPPSHLAQVGHRLWRCVGPVSRVSPLHQGSVALPHASMRRDAFPLAIPLRLPFRSHDSAAFWCIAAGSDSFHGRCLGLVAIPTGTPALSLLSEDFVWLALVDQFWIPAVLMSQ